MNRHGTGWAPPLSLVALLMLAACAQQTRHRVLSIFFDGVPPPPPSPTAGAGPEPVLSHSAGPAGGAPAAVSELERATEAAAAPAENVKSPLERVASWDEALTRLPPDIGGGVDWVRALKDGLIAPRASITANPAPRPPFTLDTLVPGVSAGGHPPLDLDVELLPAKAPFYKAVFPHSSHTLWLNCSSCHPGIVGQRPGMAAIFNGAYCGACHGRVAFSPQTSCARCHVNLTPADSDLVEADLARAREAPIPSSPELLERGRALYLEACAVCHGEKGDRDGPLAPALEVKPRDFTKGKFRFRSTASGALPTDYDLFRTITRGVPASAMPAFSKLALEDRFALVHYIKRFSERFAREKPAEPLAVPEPPPFTTELLATGKEMYTAAGCHNCHGERGAGDGPSAADLKDDWGDPIRPFDFTSGRAPKHGPTAQDYYRALATGLTGAPMPAFGDVFEPEQAWAVVAYTMSLDERGRGPALAVKGDIAFPREPREGELPPATFPHWFHRIRFRCAACHPTVFAMKRGANPMTMDAMREGKYCGACHNRGVAWPIAFDTCARCHAQSVTATK